MLSIGARREYLGHLLILHQKQFPLELGAYIFHFNQARLHQDIE
jgi:hypothetical protein